MSDSEYLEKTKFVSNLGLSLHLCGATSHRIERHLTNVCEHIGIRGTFLLTPTSFTFCYWLTDPTDQHIQIERVEPSENDLGKLEVIDSLVERFESKELSFEEMRTGLDEAMAMPPNYNMWLNCCAWMGLSAGLATLLSDSASDAVAAGFITFIIFFVVKIAARSKRTSNTVEILASLSAGLVASGIAAAGLDINVPFVVLSTIVVFIPGLALTVALSEVAQRDLVSGTSKFVHAVMTLFKLYFGAVIGVGLGSAIWGTGSSHTSLDLGSLPSWRTLPAVTLITLTLMVAFNIPRKHILGCVASAAIGFYVASIGETYFGISAGMFLGAMCVGLFSNMIANWKNIPASIILAEGLILLVPGSKTYILLDAWITGENMLSRVPNGGQAFLIFVSLVMGLLFANAILPTRKSL